MILKSPRNNRYLAMGMLLLCGLLSNATQQTAQQGPILSSNDVVAEASLVSLLRNSDAKGLGSDIQLLQALEALKELSRKKEVKLDETFSQLGRFIDVETDEREGVRSNLESHPAMGALYFGGEKALPVLTDILVSEPQDSRRSELALWTLIYLEHFDSHKVSLRLVDMVNKSPSGREREQLMAAARKAEALHLIMD